jgi:hypothetical protein
MRLTAYFGVLALAALVLTTGGRPAYAEAQGVTIDPRGTLYLGGAYVTVSGLLQVPESGFFSLNVILSQSKGGQVLYASRGVAFLSATGEPQGWAATLEAPFGEPFTSGPALVSVTVYDGDGSVLANTNARVSLHK